MQPNERRRKIIEILNLRRHDTMQNLANEFGVSRLTIYRDLLILEEDYPLIRASGRAGGIAFPDGYCANKRYLPHNHPTGPIITPQPHNNPTDPVPAP